MLLGLLAGVLPALGQYELKRSSFTILRATGVPTGANPQPTRPQFASMPPSSGGTAAINGSGSSAGITFVAQGGTFSGGNLAATGTAFAKDVLPSAPHSIEGLNDGTYGNSSSWIPNSANSFAGISLGAVPVSVNRIAFGRDNTGTLTDRAATTYTLQFTTVANPNDTTTTWTTIGTLNLADTLSFPSPALRHLFAFPTVQATGIRLIVAADNTAIDEIELYHSGTVAAVYPKGGRIVNGSPEYTLQIVSMTFGGSFAPGVPRYSMGDEITAPLLSSTNVPVASTYWRKEPLRPGELVQHPDGSSVTPVAANATLNYYYSPHAKRVFAHKPGRVGITWVSNNAPAGGRYDIFTEFFNVSSSTTRPLRTMYWTQRDFFSPVVSITSTQVTSVNPLFYSGFPASVAQEYQPPSAQQPYPNQPLLGTLWAEAVAGTFQINAYNVEGRIMVEYLGALQEDNTHQFLGADIINVERAPQPQVKTVYLGEQILPRDGDVNLTASPIQNITTTGTPYHSLHVPPDGRPVYFAERENTTPDRVAFNWQESLDAGIHFLAAPAQPGLTVLWPKYLDRYLILWPDDLNQYVTTIVPSGGSTAATGLRFENGKLPTLVHQDDISQTQAVLNTSTLRLTVSLGTDSANRTLLKFSEGDQIWYVRLLTQDANAVGFQERLVQLNGNEVAGSVLNAAATVGQPITPPSAAYESAGYIAEGTNYYPAGYIDPNSGTDFTNAANSVIIPVNAKPGANALQVWWFRKVTPPNAAFASFYVPAKKGAYTAAFPGGAPKIVLASNDGSGDLSSAAAAGSIYTQNDAALPGYNPNEEHAMLLGGRAYALRDDLNVTSGAGYSSEPYVLVAHSVAGKGAMNVFRVVRDEAPKLFSYTLNAGTIVPPPMPIPLLPLALDATGKVKNTEVAGSSNDPKPNASAPAHYDRFTFKDRKGYVWCYRGPHDSGPRSFEMKFWYPMQAGFFFPGRSTQPTVGTALPYLRALSSGVPVGDAVTGDPLSVTYKPSWPANLPELQVGETLTLPKFGLPGVRGQTSAEVLYQQSIARGSNTATSVTLYDPTRAKTALLGQGGVSLQNLPASIAITSRAGKTYFQLLPPHLQQRFYFDPNRGTKGGLVFIGQFVDEVAGDDFLHLNVLSPTDVASVKNLVQTGQTDKTNWDAAIDLLTSKVETFEPNPAKAGTFRVASSYNSPATSLATAPDSDTAVDSYALTATGKGEGYATLLFADGDAFTPQGEPVVMKVIKVVRQLYVGQVKALTAANPLDEKVTLRHTGDFAAVPEDYEFDWRYAESANGQAPAVYTQTMVTRLNSGALFNASRNGTTSTFPYSNGGTIAIRTAGYDSTGAVPGLTLTADAPVNIGASVPNQIIFSARLGEFDGLVLLVNNRAAFSYNAPALYDSISSPPQGTLHADGLALQWSVDRRWFTPGNNSIAVQLFTTANQDTLSTPEFRVQAPNEVDQVVSNPTWIVPNGTLSNIVTTGGGPTAPLGSPVLVLSDNWFVMRYRPKVGRGNILAMNSSGVPTMNQADVAWSRWIPPVLVEGWIKRVLAGINPFKQRTDDLFNNAVNTDVSLITQAGKRWEGDVALSLENINDFGLIEIYETVLNRGKNISIDSGYDHPGANDALLLAAGYLNDLYTILGNEAYADAANPTISVDDQNTSTEVNTSRYSFEGQTASVLEEELALLRGRDDAQNPGVRTTPAYNRLYWNYTRGINSGEALYAVNYNIQEKVGSSAYNGTIDAADAQYMFPQGHGDAYGHYLTALKGYYRLLTNTCFTWTPRTEAVTVLGQPVQVDYLDERKFAAAASNLAKTSKEIIALVHRQSYRDDSSEGWVSLSDTQPTNASTGITRKWGLDEWSARAGMGTYVNWIVANAMLRDVDSTNTGIQKIDRSTVPEINELSAAGSSIQTTLDNANAHLNPLGLSPGAIAFDISPAALQSGSSHYDQIHERALRSVLNARGAFNQAAVMTRSLRNQANTLDDYYSTIFDTEFAYNNKLKAIYGTPYPADMGAGKTYSQDYGGPDLIHWSVVDRSSSLVDTSAPVTLNVQTPVQADSSQAFAFTLSQNAAQSLFSFSANRGIDARDLIVGGTFFTKITQSGAVRFTQTIPQTFTTRTVTVQPSSWVYFSDQWFTGTTPGVRSQVGKLQTALTNVQSAYVEILNARAELGVMLTRFERDRILFDEFVTSNQNARGIMLSQHFDNNESATTAAILRNVADKVSAVGNIGLQAFTALANALPMSLGVAPDVAFIPRTIIRVNGAVSYAIGAISAAGINYKATTVTNENLERRFYSEIDLSKLQTNFAEKQMIHEFLLRYDEFQTSQYKIAQILANYQTALEELRNVIAEGDIIFSERETFRKRAAAIIQGYRTKDLTFRAFRNEALEQYRSLYDLAARYTYLSAKSYDYETGLLGTTQGMDVLSTIIASRALGDLTGDIPQATVSTLGDAGLAGTMARLQADWTVVKGRLGINNAAQNSTLFSLRQEFFRILKDPAITDDDDAWTQVLQQHMRSNLLTDADIANHCLSIKKADGSPVPGFVIPFTTTIEDGHNYFGQPLAAGDHAFHRSSYSTKIHSSGIVLEGYVGMDSYAAGNPNGAPNSTAPNALSATPYIYIIPCGADSMWAPPLGDQGSRRNWTVHDQALPLPFNLGGNAFSATQFFSADGTLTSQPWIVRKHPAFRPVSDPTLFYGYFPQEFTNTRLIGRSAWNTQWKLVIPANTLLSNEQEGMNRFVASVKDILLFLRTYSYSGN